MTMNVNNLTAAGNSSVSKNETNHDLNNFVKISLDAFDKT